MLFHRRSDVSFYTGENHYSTSGRNHHLRASAIRPKNAISRAHWQIALLVRIAKYSAKIDQSIIGQHQIMPTRGTAIANTPIKRETLTPMTQSEADTQTIADRVFPSSESSSGERRRHRKPATRNRVAAHREIRELTHFHISCLRNNHEAQC